MFVLRSAAALYPSPALNNLGGPMLLLTHLCDFLNAQVPDEWELVAVPLHDLYHSEGKFGPYIAAVPFALSRFRLTLVD
jgi:Nucleotide hydrolase